MFGDSLKKQVAQMIVQIIQMITDRFPGGFVNGFICRGLVSAEAKWGFLFWDWPCPGTCICLSSSCPSAASHKTAFWASLLEQVFPSSEVGGCCALPVWFCCRYGFCVGHLSFQFNEEKYFWTTDELENCWFYFPLPELWDLCQVVLPECFLNYSVSMLVCLKTS